jgi:hypothetical protein
MMQSKKSILRKGKEESGRQWEQPRCLRYLELKMLRVESQV